MSVQQALSHSRVVEDTHTYTALSFEQALAESDAVAHTEQLSS